MKEEGFIFLTSIVLMMIFILIIQTVLPIFNNSILYMKDYSMYEQKLIIENIINSLLISYSTGDNIKLYGMDSLVIIQDLKSNPPIEYKLKFTEDGSSYELLLFGEEYNKNLFKLNLTLFKKNEGLERRNINEEGIEFFIPR